MALTFVLLKLLIWGQPVKRLKVAFTFGFQFGSRPVKLLKVALTFGFQFGSRPVKLLKVALTFLRESGVEDIEVTPLSRPPPPSPLRWAHDPSQLD